MNLKANQKLILILPILAGACWGFGGVFVRFLTAGGLNNLTILSTRFIGACAILFVGIVLFKRDLFKIKLKDLWIFVGSGLTGVMMLNICYNESILHSTLSLSAVLLSLAPIWALILSAIIFKEKLTPKKIGCLIAAIFGCILVTGILEGSNGQWSFYGILFGLLSSVFWALYGIFSKVATERGYSTYTIIFYSFLLIAIVLIPFSDWSAFNAFIMADQVNNSVLAIMHSIINSVLPYLLFTLAIARVDAGKVSILCGGAEPTSAAIFGMIIFAEIPSILNIIGIIITIVALSTLISLSEN